MIDDTICAIATPIGEGGIGVIRISGDLSLNILKKIFVDGRGREKEFFEPRRMYFGRIRDNFSDKIVDEVLCVYMKAPNSYTAEDVVEIQCHGSVVALRKILDLVVKNGARIAEAGEFTKRAFLNGRLDLSQAEAVIDLIGAKTSSSFETALSQLEGKYSHEVRLLRSKIMDVLVNLSVNIDYPDEDIEELTYCKLIEDLQPITSKVAEILGTYDYGRILKEGISTAIVGRPNVGKSSLMNALLGESRAIVTAVPGTTRDTIEEMVNIDNIPIRLVDTAGIRQTDDEVESIGIERSKNSFFSSDLIIYVVDNNSCLGDEDRRILDLLKEGEKLRKKVIVAVNKIDLEQTLDVEEIKRELPSAELVHISALENSGVESLRKKISGMVVDGKVRANKSILLTNARHKELFAEAEDSLCDALEAATKKEPPELIEIDVNNAYMCLGRIVGEETEDDIINQVFSRFCLGK